MGAGLGWILVVPAQHCYSFGQYSRLHSVWLWWGCPWQYIYPVWYLIPLPAGSGVKAQACQFSRAHHSPSLKLIHETGCSFSFAGLSWKAGALTPCLLPGRGDHSAEERQPKWKEKSRQGEMRGSKSYKYCVSSSSLTLSHGVLPSVLPQLC